MWPSIYYSYREINAAYCRMRQYAALIDCDGKGSDLTRRTASREGRVMVLAFLQERALKVAVLPVAAR
ncbi:hypothetical protein SAMN05216387_10260 [Nitrosovibrio tenuis]|uniref:Uncharacterized protein n=1 Tax=Nitrosovibrio tenuis TaxID=1233 RepID=A0A1H7I4Q4_9PROT|nr:hypothetical protein SAMN05216387_10260 [Nitrosovibrio tenuis]